MGKYSHIVGFGEKLEVSLGSGHVVPLQYGGQWQTKSWVGSKIWQPFLDSKWNSRDVTVARFLARLSASALREYPYVTTGTGFLTLGLVGEFFTNLSSYHRIETADVIWNVLGLRLGLPAGLSDFRRDNLTLRRDGNRISNSRYCWRVLG